MRNFSERFKDLIREDVPRTFLHSKDEIEQVAGLKQDYPEPQDGFVAHYCKAQD